MKALKKVPGKNKGLSKLPTAVRNKMGYMKKGGKVYQDGGAVDPTKKMKKADEAEIDRRYESAVGRNSRTGNLNYPNSVDMDKYESTAGSAGNDNKLRKAVSDKYYAEQRNKMGIDKIKTYKSGGKVVKYQKGGANPSPTERTMTSDEIRITASPGNQPSANYKGYEKKKTPKEVLEGTEAKRLRMALQNKFGPLRNESLGQLRKIAKTDGVYDDAVKAARNDYQKEMAKRR
jgi:hypothetical protein